MTIVASTHLRVGWGGVLGNTIGIRFDLTPSSTGAPLADMTTVTSVSIRVERGDGYTVDTWACTFVESTAEVSSWTYVFVDGDLSEVETLTCTALMTTTPGTVVPSVAFELTVDP